MGNTCYMNSSLQCLQNTPELSKYFLQDKHEQYKYKSSPGPLSSGGEMVKAYEQFIKEAWWGTKGVVLPSQIKKVLGDNNPRFAGYDQQDSTECIISILDLLHEDLYKQDARKEYYTCDTTLKNAPLISWNQHLMRNESIILDLFHGQQQTNYRCDKCGFITRSFDAYSVLTLPIPTLPNKQRR